MIKDVSTWDIFALFSNADVVRYMGVRQLHSMDDAVTLMRDYQTSPTRWLSVYQGPRFLGIAGLEIYLHQATIVLASNGTRRGFGREFSVPFVQWIFTHSNIWRVSAYCHVDNAPVQRVLRRMGAECEGRLRRFGVFPNISDEPQDVYIYSIVR